MASYTWLGGSGLWTDGADWTDGSATGTPPGPGDTATVETSGLDEFFGVATAASLTSFGTILFAGSASFGAVSAIGATTVLPGASVTTMSATLGGSIDVSGPGSSLTVDDTLILYGASGTAVTVFDGGSVRVGSIAPNPGNSSGTFYVDPTATMEVGGGGIATAGTLALDAGAAVAVSYATFATPVLDDTTVVDEANVAVGAMVSGSGTLELTGAATLTIAADVASTLTIAFTGSGQTLDLPNGTATIGATITGFGAGDVIDTGQLAVTSVSYAATAPGLGTLSLLDDGVTVERLTLAGNYTTAEFVPVPDPSDYVGYKVELVSTPATPPAAAVVNPGGDAYALTLDGSNDRWAVAANWTDTTTGTAATTAPGATNAVTIGNATSGIQVLNGDGNSASLSESGLIALNGAFATGQLTIASFGTIVLDDGSTLTATDATIDGAVLVGSQSRLVVAGLADLGGSFDPLEANDGGFIGIRGLIADRSVDGDLTVIDGGTIEFGQAGGAVAGAVNVDAGVLLTFGLATIDAAVVNNGTMAFAGSGDIPTSSISGAISGSGTLEVGSVAVRLAGAVAASQTVSLAGTAAVLEIGALASFEAPIVGMALGDTIEVDPSVASAAFTRTTGDSGTLTLSDGQGATVATLDVTVALGAAGAGTFLVLPNVSTDNDAPLVILASGTLQSGVAPAPAAGTAGGATFTWSGPGGDWGTAANWGTTAAPGVMDTATLSANDADTRIVSGSGNAASLTVTADYVLSGVFTFGTLNVEPSPAAVGYLDIVAGATVTAGTVSVDSGTLDVDGPGARLDVSGTLTLGFSVDSLGRASGADVVVAHGGSVRVDSVASILGAVTALQDTITVDATSSFEIGSAGGATAGAVQIDAGRSLGNQNEVGQFTIDANVVDDGSISAVDKLIDIAGSVTGIGTIVIGGTIAAAGPTATAENSGGIVFLEGAVSAGQSIVMAGTGDRLTLGLETAATIAGFAVTDQLMVRAEITSVVFTQSSADSGTLALDNDGTLVETLNLSGRYTTSEFIASATPEAIGGLFDLSTIEFAAACFAEGTRILTEAGPIAIERLSVGDRVVSAFGGTAPVVWLGHRTIRCTRHPRPWDVMPVRVAADAFGLGSPARDLRLSPDHAVHVDGRLIPVRYLINGATIVQEHAEIVTWWHLELPQHDVVLAEGLPAESYLDTGNRAAFAGGGAAIHAHADFSRGVWEAQACADLLTEGFTLDAIRARLLTRAAISGHGTTTDDALSIEVGGVSIVGGVLPPDARQVVLRSRASAPAWFGAADHRRLGVAVGSVVLDGMALQLDDPRLVAGWHAPEGSWRWTDGAATLNVTGACTMSVTRAFPGRYWAAA